MQGIRPTLGAVLLAETTVLGVLWWLGGEFSPWSTDGASAEQALAGVVWLVATALAAWLFVTTVASVAAHASRLPAAIAATDWMTHPAIRNLARRATAVCLVASSVGAPTASLANEAPPIPVVVVTESTPPTTAPDTPPAPTPPPILTPPQPRTSPPTTEAPSPETAWVAPGGHPMHRGLPTTESAGASYTVQPGDNMWTITAGHLEASLGHAPSNTEISEMWRQVIELNTPNIRSGDADLIFPGEELILPAVGA